MSSILEDTELIPNWYENIRKSKLRNYLVYTPMNFNTALLNDEQINFICADIEKYLKLYNVSKIALEFEQEGFNLHLLFNLSTFAKKIIATNRFTIDDFVLVIGLPGTSYNQQFYKNLFKSYPDLLTLSIEFSNKLEEDSANIINSDIDIFNSISVLSEPKIKKFICFNSATRGHRIYFLGKFLQNNLIDSAFYSFNFNFDDKSNYKATIESHLPYPTIYKNTEWIDIKNAILSNLDKFPMYISMFNRNHGFNHFSSMIDIEKFKQCYFSLVTETSFVTHNLKNNILDVNGNMFDNHFITEKTWKVFQVKHPFIIASNAGILKTLKELGYKTFHPYINEEYDDIKDDELRLNAIYNEVVRLCSLSDNELNDWLVNIEPIVTHNFNHMRFRDKIPFYLDRKEL